MIEIQIENPKNQSLYFRPLQRPLRGTFDFNRVSEPMGRMHVSQFPRPVPGLHVAIDPEKRTAEIRDPLHNVEHATIREWIEKKSLKLGPAVERFENIDVPTWLFWMKRAVVAGMARIVDGKFPEFDERKARRDFLNVPDTLNPRDNLIDKLVAIAFAGLPKDRREEMAALFEG